MAFRYLGIGAAKCATTWTHRILGTHPDVRLAERKELNFWKRPERSSFEWYSATMAEDDPSVVMGDISPSYTRLSLSGIELVRSHYPDVPIFLNVRHPVERIWSRAKQLIREQGLVLSELTNAEIAPYVFHHRELGISDYAKHLQTWLSVFPEEQILVSRFEEIVKDPHHYFERLCAHIGIDAERLTITPGDEDNPDRPLPEEFSAQLYAMLAGPMARLRDQFGIDYT